MLKKDKVVVGHSQVDNRGHTNGQAMADDQVQDVSSVVGWLCDVLRKIKTI